MALHVDIFADRPNYDPSWLCAYTQPGREFFAAANLELEDFGVYLPVTRITRNGIARKTPLFSSYLFVRKCRKLPRLRKIEGILGIIAQNDEPLTIRDAVITELRSRECNGLISTEDAVAPAIDWKLGTAVRIVQGTYSGLTATFERMLNRHRASVRMSCLGRATPISIPIEALVAQADYQPIYVR